MINELVCTQVHPPPPPPPQGKRLIYDYIQPAIPSRILETLQVLVHIVTFNCKKNFVDQLKPQKFNTTKIFSRKLFLT